MKTATKLLACLLIAYAIVAAYFYWAQTKAMIWHV